MPTIYLGMADKYGNIVGTSENDKLLIEIVATSNGSDV